MNRREFSWLAAAGLISTTMDPAYVFASVAGSDGPLSRAPWPGGAYRRLLMDTHVPDWDPAFLASYDPVDYVRSAANAEFQCVSQYANSHVGLCLWPTKIGQPHAALKGRDFFGDTVRECRKRDLDVLAYYSLIFDIWAYETYPDWRMVAEYGKVKSSNGRNRFVCPNSPYAGHAQAVLKELVGTYAIDGIFLDMTFWPVVCYCPYCEARFHKEQGKPLPRIVNWNDPTWRTFQASRQAWMLEFARNITQTIKDTRSITVTHQCSTVFHDWESGVPLQLMREACDYVGADFYGGPSQYSLACKLFNTLTQAKPFEFHTSRTIGLGDFETTKPLRELTVSSFVATLHSAACLFIDAIKPDGEFDHAAYDLMGAVNQMRKPYEPYLGGNLLANVAIYYDRDSFYDPTQNGLSPVDVKHAMPAHLQAMTGVARALRQAHLPYGMVTNVTLNQLSGYEVLVVPDVLELTSENASIFREFVRKGGVLIATGTSSLDTHAGEPHFLLEDVLGVKYLGIIGTSFSYLTPLREEERNLILPQDAISYAGPIVKVEPLPGTLVIAAATLPWVAPEAGSTEDGHFSQVWSNPPAQSPGSDPGITIHPYGEGKAIWIAAPIETAANEVNDRILISLLKDAYRGTYRFEAETHPSVEVTLFDQPQHSSLLLGLLNMESEDPPLPIPATVRVKVPEGRRIVSAVHLPDQKQMEITQSGDYVTLGFSPFTLLEMAQLKYE